MNVDQALDQLVTADSIPAQGPELVRYLGGRRDAVQTLTGLDHSPRRSEYPDDAAYRADYTRWRSASRKVQRWSAPAGRQQRGQLAPIRLAADERERARDEDRARKLSAIRRHGIRATVTARIIVDSPGRGGRDSRHRTISDGGHGILVENGTEILDAVRRGDLDEAEQLLLDGFLEAVPLPPYTELTEASWDLRPA